MLLPRLRRLAQRALELRIWLMVVVSGPAAAILFVFVGVYHVRRFMLATKSAEHATRALLVAMILAFLALDVWGWLNFIRPPDPGRKLSAAAAVIGCVVVAEILFWAAW